jgi:nitrogen-specific signal transduction histidine kinase
VECQTSKADFEGSMARKAMAGAAAGSRSKRSETKAPTLKSSTASNHHRDEIAQMRTLAHDLSNALEAILQASYLLSQSKLDDDPKRWAQLIDSSSQEAARLNREIRRLLRSLSEE